MSKSNAIDRLFVTGGGLIGDAIGTTSRIGTRIGPYCIIDELGRGGMATVYLGERDDNTFDQTVAIKVLDTSSDSPGAAGFLEERRLLASLDHPSIARIYDGGTLPDGAPYLVMERVRGVRIDEHWQTLDLDGRLKLFIEVCRAVEAAHVASIVHHDLKVQNILVDPHGRPKLLDFGIARALRGTSSTDPRLLTPGCAAPEQFEGQSAGPATDVFQLGLMLFELATDERATRESSFEGLRKGSRHLPRVPPSQVHGPFRRRLDADFDRIVASCLAAEAADRYSNAGLLADDLEAWRTGRVTSLSRQRPAGRARHFLRRQALLIGASVSALAIIGSLLAYAWMAVEREQAKARSMTQLARDVLIDGGFESPDRITANSMEIAQGAFADEPGLEKELAKVAARKLIDDGNPSDAINLIEQVLTRAGGGFERPVGTALLHGLLGEAYRMTARPDAAVAHLSVAIDAPDAVDTQARVAFLEHRAAAHLTQGDPASAEADLSRALELAMAGQKEPLRKALALLQTALETGCPKDPTPTHQGIAIAAVAAACERGLLPGPR